MFDGQVRLVDGSFPSEGRAEVYCNGEWGTICSDEFDFYDALTICLQLGFNSFVNYRDVGLSS